MASAEARFRVRVRVLLFLNLDIVVLALNVVLGLALDGLVLGLVSDLALNRVLVYRHVVKYGVGLGFKVRFIG